MGERGRRVGSKVEESKVKETRAVRPGWLLYTRGKAEKGRKKERQRLGRPYLGRDLDRMLLHFAVLSLWLFLTESAAGTDVAKLSISRRRR